jgi:hypothetical protein
MQNRADRMKEKLETAVNPAERKKGITMSGARSKVDRLYYCAQAASSLMTAAAYIFPNWLFSPATALP